MGRYCQGRRPFWLTYVIVHVLAAWVRLSDHRRSPEFLVTWGVTLALAAAIHIFWATTPT